MKFPLAAALALIALPLHAQQIYRCGGSNGTSYQDHPCSGDQAAPAGGYVQPTPSAGDSAADHYRAYLQMAEHDDAVRQQQRLAAAAAAPAQPAPMSETDRRAVFNCNADAQVDALRHNRPTFSCDQRTGEKKLVEQVTVVNHDRQSSAYASR